MKVVYITKLYLENFRCYDKFEIDFDKELTVIVAENGQGKTADRAKPLFLMRLP